MPAACYIRPQMPTACYIWPQIPTACYIPAADARRLLHPDRRCPPLATSGRRCPPLDTSGRRCPSSHRIRDKNELTASPMAQGADELRATQQHILAYEAESELQASQASQAAQNLVHVEATLQAASQRLQECGILSNVSYTGTVQAQV
jgi:hypothetical protein